MIELNDAWYSVIILFCSSLSCLSRLTDQTIPYGNENLRIKCVKIIAKQIDTVLHEHSGKEE